MACISKRRNRYVIDFYDQYGKRRWKTLPQGTNKARAKEELRAIEDMVAQGVFLPKAKVPLFSEVSRNWIEYKRTNLRASTWEVYEGHVRNHFKDLDGLRINSITTATVEKFITTRQQQGMNINTLRKILVTLGQIFSYSVRHKYIDHNPLRDAERPRSNGNEPEGKNKITILSPAQINTFLDNVQGRKYKTLFLLAIMSGARQGDLLGLKWDDLDLVNNQIHIQRTFNNGRFFTTKTKASNRKIDLGAMVMTELKRWKLACPKNKLNLIFPNQAGNPINHNNLVSRHFEPALKRAGLPVIRFHDLRHTYASLLIEQRENIKYIQNQLGHSTPTVTLNVYAHLMKSKNSEAACRLEETIFETNGSKMVAEMKTGTNDIHVSP